jgi:hypothetical protein
MDTENEGLSLRFEGPLRRTCITRCIGLTPKERGLRPFFFVPPVGQWQRVTDLHGFTGSNTGQLKTPTARRPDVMATYRNKLLGTVTDQTSSE